MTSSLPRRFPSLLAFALAAIALGASGCSSSGNGGDGGKVVDAGADAASDAQADASDAATDADVDASSDAGADADVDASSDAGADADVDAGTDAAMDAGPTCTTGAASCSVPSDCPAQGTVCLVNTCTGGCCGTSRTPVGSACSDNGGVVCDGWGNCTTYHCGDGVKDADETDFDCGGSCGPTCADGKACLVGNDCISRVCDPGTHTCAVPSCTDGVRNGNESDVDCGGVDCRATNPCGTNQICYTATDCQSGYCAGTTCQLRENGISCWENTQCKSGYCVNGICCSGACNGTCEACQSYLTGSPTGTCAKMLAGNAAPTGQCTANPPCGNTGYCAMGGACAQADAGTSCGTGMMCDGIGNCN